MRLRLPALLLALLLPVAAHAQFGPAGPPAVGVVAAQPRAVRESTDYVGRIQAIDRVDIVARVTAFIEKRAFTEGAEVRQGDLLYQLERGPFEADLASKQATVAQTQALLKNAIIVLNRAQSLLNTPAGQRSTVDDALAQQASLLAQLQGNFAQVRASQINLDYTEIHAPVAGRITRSALSVGNVVTPTSGPLATIVSQDPMYVLFPIPARVAIDLSRRNAGRGGLAAVRVRLRLPDGTDYGEIGALDYIDPSVAANTDTLMLRARIANPLRPGATAGAPDSRELIDDEFVTVILEGAEPVQALAVPRAAVLEDQQGSFVYVVGADHKVEQRRVKLGQSTPQWAVITSGLSAGETVVSDGLQRVRPGIVVNPAPADSAAAAAPSPRG
jgi:membrane fusion protein (multidrug efflux system)